MRNYQGDLKKQTAIQTQEDSKRKSKTKVKKIVNTEAAADLSESQRTGSLTTKAIRTKSGTKSGTKSKTPDTQADQPRKEEEKREEEASSQVIENSRSAFSRTPSIKTHENNNNKDNISNLSEVRNLDCSIVFACSNPVQAGGACCQIQVGEKAFRESAKADSLKAYIAHSQFELATRHV